MAAAVLAKSDDSHFYYKRRRVLDGRVRRPVTTCHSTPTARRFLVLPNTIRGEAIIIIIIIIADRLLKTSSPNLLHNTHKCSVSNAKRLDLNYVDRRRAHYR